MNTEIEIMKSDDAVMAVTKAEVDIQIATAHQYPRSIANFQNECSALATMTPEIAQECIFSLPRGGKTIQGESIRLAEIVAHTYCNLRIGSRQISDDGKSITVQAVCHDLEKNVAIQTEVKRRITYKDGRRYNDDMIIMAINAAQSIAVRNAIFKAVPKALIANVVTKIKAVIVGDEATFEDRKKKCFEYFKSLGVDKKAVLKALGIKGDGDVDGDIMITLTGIASGIKSGEFTAKDAFDGMEKKATNATKTANTISEKIEAEKVKPISEKELFIEMLNADCDGEKSSMVAIFEALTGKATMDGFKPAEFKKLYDEVKLGGEKRQDYVDSLGICGREPKQ